MMHKQFMWVTKVEELFKRRFALTGRSEKQLLNWTKDNCIRPISKKIIVF